LATRALGFRAQVSRRVLACWSTTLPFSRVFSLVVREAVVKGSLRRSSFVSVPLACEVLSRARLARRPGSESRRSESVPLAPQLVTGLIGRMSAAARKLPYQGAQPTSTLPCSGMVLRIHQAVETTSPTILSMTPVCVSVWPHMLCQVHSCGSRPRSPLKFLDAPTDAQMKLCPMAS